MAKKSRPVLRWFGGKFRLAEWIVSQMPAHRIYTEAYGGAGSVLFKKPRSKVEVWNDIDDSVYHLFWTLKHPDLALELKRQLEVTPYSRREFELASRRHPDPVESARRLIVRSFMGYGADSASSVESEIGFRANSNRSNTAPARDWRNYVSHVDGFVERLMGVVIESRPALDILQAHDTPDTLHYVDPPYHHDTRRPGRYKHEMNDRDHDDLLGVLSSLKGSVILSGYANDAYSRLGWREVHREALADGAAKRTEILWIKTS
jgi:DNA adenine methylase